MGVLRFKKYERNDGRVIVQDHALLFGLMLASTLDAESNTANLILNAADESAFKRGLLDGVAKVMPLHDSLVDALDDKESELRGLPTGLLREMRNVFVNLGTDFKKGQKPEELDRRRAFCTYCLVNRSTTDEIAIAAYNNAMKRDSSDPLGWIAKQFSDDIIAQREQTP